MNLRSFGFDRQTKPQAQHMDILCAQLQHCDKDTGPTIWKQRRAEKNTESYAREPLRGYGCRLSSTCFQTCWNPLRCGSSCTTSQILGPCSKKWMAPLRSLVNERTLPSGNHPQPSAKDNQAWTATLVMPRGPTQFGMYVPCYHPQKHHQAGQCWPELDQLTRGR